MSKGGRGGGMTYPMPTIQNSSTNTSQYIPAWLENASQAGVANAGRLLGQPTQAYTGQIAPDMNADQLSAGNMIRSSVGAYQPYFDEAANMTRASATAAPNVQAATFGQGLQGAIDNYMNPYVSNVIDSVRDMSQGNLERSLNQTRDQAISARAFGGSRHGVQEGIATAQNNRDTNNLIANLLSSGYDRATGLMGQDISNNLQSQLANQSMMNNALNRTQAAGSQMANVGTANRAANVADVNNLLTFGGMGQQTTGAQQQAAYQEFLRQQNMPIQLQQLFNQTVSSAPRSTTGTSNTSSVSMAPQQQTSSSPLSTALGLGLGGLSLLGSGGLSGLGSIGLGLLGASPFPSSYSNPRMP